MECFLRCAGLGLQLTALCLFNVLINRMANVLNAMGRLFSGVLMAKYQILKKKTSSAVLQSREEGSNKGLKDSNFSFGCEQKKHTQKRLIYFLNWQNRMKV